MHNKKKKLSLFNLVMISSAFVISIRNLPTIADTQFKMIFFGIVAALIFFIPSGLVSAELATGWPKMGGIAVWVTEAFGKRWGFAASFFQWTYMSISVIAMLYFISSSFAFVFNPKLAENRAYLICAGLILIWLFTILNLKGLKISKQIATIGFLSGVLFPAIVLIGLSIVYLMLGNPINIDLSVNAKNIFPDFKDISTIVLLVGFIRAFAGIEGSAAHANSVQNPSRNYPIAILIVVVLGLLVNILGSMSVAFMIPQAKISLVAGVMDAFVRCLELFKLSFFIPLFGFLVALGQIGGFSTWLTGPVKGILELAQEGQLPPFFQKENKYGVPSTLMIIQAVIISCTSTAFLLFTGSINAAFWTSVAFSMLIYVSMYFLMFLSALYLRYKKPNVERSYKVPGKKIGIWVVSLVGMIGMVLAFIIAFIPPSQLEDVKDKLLVHYLILMIGIILVYFFPYLITALKKSKWNIKK